MKRHNYIPTISSLYLNYIFQGIAMIIISQNMSILREHWQASLSQVSIVLSAVGFGRILSVNTAGFLSDKFGRKFSILIGTASYIVFYLGLLWSPTYQIAALFAVCAGFGNAFLDTGTYPVVVEAFDNPRLNSALSVLNKAFISLGQFVLPLITRFIFDNGHYFGWTFLVSALCLAVNFGLVCYLPFPSHRQKSSREEPEQITTATIVHSRFLIEGVALLLFSFVSVSLFNIFITWIPTFAQGAIHMSEGDSLVLVSYYSVFSFISVFVTSFIVNRGINIPRFMIFCTLMTGSSLLYMLFSPSMFSILIATFCIGFFSAGGIWQLGLALLLEFFPYQRGMMTSYYSLATSISVMGVPYLTGLLAEINYHYVFMLNMALAFLGSICLFVVSKRYRILFYK